MHTLSHDMADSTDSVLRAMTDDGSFRVMSALTTGTVREAARTQKVSGRVAALLADLITGAILVRETMSPNQRVQMILVGRGGLGQIIADSNPNGSARGLVRISKRNEELELGDGAMLKVMRSLPNGELHRGIIEVPADATVSEMLMVYMKVSEQVDSMISVGCSTEDGEVRRAGGYIVQLLPELEEGRLLIMQERIKDFQDMTTLLGGPASSPAKLTEELLYLMDYTRLSESELRFECGCSDVRVITSLAALPRHDIEELLASGESLEMSCDYCGRDYSVGPEQLRGLLEPGS